MSKRVLIVEDEPDILELINFNLSAEGFLVTTALSAEEGWEKLPKFKPDLVLLDIMLPGKSGLDFCKDLKSEAEYQNIPVIMLTARDSEDDIIKGLDGGADDYVAKPFSPKVLISRIHAVLRRSEANLTESDQIRYESLVMHTDEHRVELEGKPLVLTISEFNILKALMEKPGRAFTRQQLIDIIRGTDYAVTDRTIDFQMVGLRRKLGPLGQNIETVRGVGYRLKGDSLELQETVEVKESIF